ncbi:hypothetical protein [Chitinophaga sp. LS1]|uniref:hypothetical protein n=1 Tax=Chitinophaga sp. LS1 TaxID=3051176 RepID=UPI002AAC005E|nr:hypothetical protein [Chitinophaga sp. LS1]WPV70476.1 hypothetical protein QQL36_17345 [Chitinophaga sp. LS1]
MKYFYILVVAMGFAGCDPAPGANGSDSTAVVAPSVATDTLPWKDALVERYVQHSDNALLKSIGKDSVSWIWDRMVTNKTTTYYICNIGKDVVDAGGARFVSAQWVYIDTVNRQLYEYDVPKDTLIKWNK